MMTAEQLKGSILQLAMQGKLVEQRPEEGTGEELLKKIVRCKTDGDKDFSFDDEPPFEIPESWKWVKHNFLFQISGGSQPPKSKFSADLKPGYVRLYQIRDYGDKPVPVYVDKKLVSKFTQKGDILLARYGGSLGKVFWAEDGAYNVAMAKVIPLFDESLVSKEYIYLYYHTSLYQSVVLSSTRSAQAGFNKTDLDSMFFPLPPLEEQKRIVAKIEELMPFVEQYAAANTKLNTLNATFPEMMKKSILQEAVQGKLVPQDPNDEPASLLLKKIAEEKKRLIKEGKIKKDKKESIIFRGKDGLFYETMGKQTICIQEQIPFDIPESWEWIRLRSYGQFSSGKTPSMSDPRNWDGNIPWVSPKDMKTIIINDSQMHISEDACKEMVLYPAGTLLMVVRSGILERKLPLCDLGVDRTINQDIKAFTLYHNELSEWVYYELKGFEHFVIHNLVKNVTTVDSLKFDEFQDLLVPLPPRAEQIRIIEMVNRILKDIDCLETID